jgi:heterodisulfide reductase subunit B2
MKLSYYPGCSLHGSSKEYDVSTKAVCEALGIQLSELEDWICCGASSGHSLSEILHTALPAHNLKIASQTGLDLLVPCAACYNRLKAAKHSMEESRAVREEIQDITGFDSQGGTAILNLIEILRDHIGLEELQKKISRPLKGLKAACYYGCLLVRPKTAMAFDDPEHPQAMDEVVQALGGETVQWSYKSECCGGSLSLARAEIVQKLVDTIVESAEEAGADAIVTLCPLCFENLDMRQKSKDFPIFYLTELLGLSLGLKETGSWIDKHFHDPTKMLDSLRLNP